MASQGHSKTTVKAYFDSAMSLEIDLSKLIFRFLDEEKYVFKGRRC